jgi:hypothetical protein
MQPSDSVSGLRPSDQALKNLHGLPVSYCIVYKLCVLMHQVHTGRSPRYLFSLITATANIPSRAGLRSGNSQRYELPGTVCKFGERSFSFAGPSAWNTLPSDLQQQNDAKLSNGFSRRFYFLMLILFVKLCSAPLVTRGVSGACNLHE